MAEIKGYVEYSPYCAITTCSQCKCAVDTGKGCFDSPSNDDASVRGGILCWQGCYAAFCEECMKTSAWCDKCQTQCKTCANHHARENPRAGFSCPIEGCDGIAHDDDQTQKGAHYSCIPSCFVSEITWWHCSDCDHEWETRSGDLVKRAT